MNNAAIDTSTSRGMLWTGWILSALPILAMGLAPIFMLLFNFAVVRKGMTNHGYPERFAMPLLLTEMACTLIYAIPRTAVLGAILMTGYLGGAVATHVRVGEGQFVAPVVVGIIVWLGLYFRDARVRALAPLRSAS